MKKNRLKKGIATLALAAVLLGGSLAGLMPQPAAWAAEEEGEAAAKQATLPKGPQNELEIRAAENDAAWPKGPDALWSDKAILMDMDTGTVLYEKNADEQDFPASTTKIMTAMLVLENSSMDEVVKFSKNSVEKTEGSGIWRVPGEKLTVEQCLYALMLASANECAYALAEHVTDKNYDLFIDMMNERAAALGCENTHFTNTNGLPDDKHVTTARDLARIAIAAYQNESFRKIAGTVEYTIPKTNKQDEPVLMYNHHKMFCDKKTDQYLYKYATAGKTGYTKAAGNTLVTYAEKDGRRLVCVVLRSTGDASYRETKALFQYGFKKFTDVNVAENESRFEPKDLIEGYQTADDKEVTDVQIDPASIISLPKDMAITDVDAQVVYEASEDGSQTGDIVYSLGGNELGRASILVTTQTVDPAQKAQAAAEDEETLHESKLSRFADTAKSFLMERSLKEKAILGLVALVVIILIIVGIVRGARRRMLRRELDRPYDEGVTWDDIQGGQEAGAGEAAKKDLPTKEAAVLDELMDLDAVLDSEERPEKALEKSETGDSE